MHRMKKTCLRIKQWHSTRLDYFTFTSQQFSILKQSIRRGWPVGSSDLCSFPVDVGMSASVLQPSWALMRSQVGISDESYLEDRVPLKHLATRIIRPPTVITKCQIRGFHEPVGLLPRFLTAICHNAGCVVERE